MATLPYREKFFNRTRVNAILLTAIFTIFMHPLAIFGIRFPDLGVLAWIHLVPILLIAYPLRFRHKFGIYFLSQSLANFGILYWLVIALVKHGGANFFQAVASIILLSLFLGVLAALFLQLLSWVNAYNKFPFYVLVPVFMVLKDWLLSHYPWGGFPWAIAGYSQGQWLKLFQWVDVTGNHGLGFFIYLINGLIADGLVGFLQRKQFDRMMTRFIVAFVLMMLSLFLSFMSGRHFETHHTSSGTLSAALVQANILQSEKWDPYKAQNHLQKYLVLTNRSIKNGAETVLWPETAYPYGLHLETLYDDRFLDMDQVAVPILFGAVAYNQQKEPDYRQYNGVFQVNKKARITQAYFKTHLVPFGEYLPFEAFFSKLGAVVNEAGDFDAGANLKLMHVKTFLLGPLICFEDVFPEIAREFASKGAQILINFTNDAWYEDSSAIYQHLVYSQMRALENRRPLLRVTNTGYTAVIDSKGVVIDELEPFTEGVLQHRLKVETMDSYYMRHGEAWLWWVFYIAITVSVYTGAKTLLGPVRRKDL